MNTPEPLATARTRPTRKDLVQAVAESIDNATTTHLPPDMLLERQASEVTDAVLALFDSQPTAEETFREGYQDALSDVTSGAFVSGPVHAATSEVQARALEQAADAMADPDECSRHYDRGDADHWLRERAAHLAGGEPR